MSLSKVIFSSVGIQDKINNYQNGAKLARSEKND